MKIRPERVAQLMRREVADVLANKLRDPRLSHWVSVTDVVVSDRALMRSATTLITPSTFSKRPRTSNARAERATRRWRAHTPAEQMMLMRPVSSSRLRKTKPGSRAAR